MVDHTSFQNTKQCWSQETIQLNLKLKLWTKVHHTSFRTIWSLTNNFETYKKVSHLFWTLQILIQFDHFPSLVLKNSKCAQIYNILVRQRLNFLDQHFQTETRPDPPHNCFYYIFRQQYFQNCSIITQNLNIVRVLLFNRLFCYSIVPQKVSRISGWFLYVFSICPEFQDAVGTLLDTRNQSIKLKTLGQKSTIHQSVMSDQHFGSYKRVNPTSFNSISQFGYKTPSIGTKIQPNKL